MELRFVAPLLRRLDEVRSEVLACGIFIDERPPRGTAGLVDWRLAGQIGRLMQRAFVTAERGEVVMLPLSAKLPFDKALLFGLGARESFDDEAFREVTAHMLHAMAGLSARSAVVELPGRHCSAIDPERATDILLELAGGHSEHDVWTLVEPADDQRRIAARMSELRRRDRRVVLGVDSRARLGHTHTRVAMKSGPHLASPPLSESGRVDSRRVDSLTLVRGVVRTMRPHQWLKNVFVLPPVVFAKELFVPELFLRAGGAFLVFCVLASSVYTINDIVDAPADRVHPVKRKRPIAAGVVPLSVAKVMAALLFVIAMSGALYGPPLFALVAFLYFVQNIAYSFWLKKVAYADVGCIALGFVLRVVAGGLATRIQVSGYLLACTALLALFLGFGKRSHELAGAALASTKKQRATLEAYKPESLRRALAVTGAASIVTYVAYTIDPATREMFHSNWLWLTAPNPVFGVLRFLHLVRSRPKAESPTQEMLRDAPFMLNLIIWVIVVVAIVYKLRPSAGL